MGLQVYNELGFIDRGLAYIAYTTSLEGGRGTSTDAAAHTFLELVTVMLSS
jgi:hypothetical protein